MTAWRFFVCLFFLDLRDLDLRDLDLRERDLRDCVFPEAERRRLDAPATLSYILCKLRFKVLKSAFDTRRFPFNVFDMLVLKSRVMSIKSSIFQKYTNGAG